MVHLSRRLRKLELRKREQIVFAQTAGDARLILEQRLERMHRCIQVQKERGEYVGPDPTVEEVLEMIHAHFEESRIRREENENELQSCV